MSQKRTQPRPSAEPLLEVSGLSVTFRSERRAFGGPPKELRAVRDVSFAVPRGQTVGLVGESGSGKTTVGRALLRLVPIETGTIRFDGVVVSTLGERAFLPYRKRIQTIFQDPYASLNPRLMIGDIVAEPLMVHAPEMTRRQRQEAAADLLEKVGLPADALYRYPHQFSGGQRQRICIARALSSQPDFIVCDECVSALDVSVQAQIVNLLQDLQEQLGIAYLFIAHDLAVVEHVSQTVLVMNEGRIVESAPAERIYREPQHPYTRKLLAAVPRMPTLSKAVEG